MKLVAVVIIALSIVKKSMLIEATVGSSQELNEVGARCDYSGSSIVKKSMFVAVFGHSV